jgi:hypothetical protein
VETLVEAPQIVQLLGQPLRQRQARPRPVMTDALVRIVGQVAHQFGDQLSLAAEVMVDVAAGDADGVGDLAEIERVVADEHIVLARHLLDALTRLGRLLTWHRLCLRHSSSRIARGLAMTALSRRHPATNTANGSSMVFCRCFR